MTATCSLNVKAVLEETEVVAVMGNREQRDAEAAMQPVSAEAATVVQAVTAATLAILLMVVLPVMVAW